MLILPSKVAGHTRFLLHSFHDSDFDSIALELSQLVDSGVETSIPVLKTCLDFFTVRRSHENVLQLEKLVSLVFKRALKMSNLGTLLSHALKDVELTPEFVDDLTNALNFSISEKIGFGLALADFERSDAKTTGRNLLLAEIEKLCANTGHIDSSVQIQKILLFLQKSEDLSGHLDSFINILSSAQPKDELSFALTPILSDDVHEDDVFRSADFHSDSAETEFDAILAEIDKEIAVGDLMGELGSGFTADAQQCKEILSSFAPLREAAISRILGNVARTCADLEDNHTTFSTFALALGCCIPSEISTPRSWNIDILVETIKQLAPGTSWRKVIENLDHDGFDIPNMESFSFFMRLYKTACKEPFPLDTVCASVWKNMEGQLSFLKHAISAPPEVFTFMHSPRKLEYIDNIHSHEQHLGLSNHAWLSLDLLDVLCQLAERGHAVLVSSLLQYPLTQFPRTLLLGMTQIKTAYSLIQREVASTIFPVIITNSQDSSFILNLWHHNAELVLWGILNAQNFKADSMLRIIEICHELKILHVVLESVPVSFCIRFAVLASLRGLLDIESWLPNCLHVYKDLFAEECLKFVKNVLFSESEDFTAKLFRPSDSLSDLYLDATTSLFKVLKAHNDVITSSQLVEEIEKVNAAITNCNSKLQNGEAKDSSASNVYGDDVEAEANAYFHQMFSCQLSVDSMVQMLSRYKDSMVQREKLIFECMIANLFEEYRFFPKYPERQLKIASILFGSVIKHQLISSLTLGMALRLVLDSLRKPADSKMFLFGSKALEQFVNRLVELPQYCNHILQISHLRSTHPELVTVIEQALSRVSSGNLDSDASVSLPGPSQSFPVNGELSGSGNGQSALQLPSSVQPQQKNEVHIEDRSQLPTSVPSNEASSLLASLSVTSVDVSVIPKNPGISTSSSTSAGFVRPTRGATSTRFGSALNIETLVAAAERRENAIEAPPSDVQDKVSFIINNISTANIESKGKEFAEILPQQYYPWFAQYMVMKRASIEPNFHDLYLKFLDKVDSKLLFKEILQNTYENCKVLLGSELIKSSSEERSLLKNLGSWLGKLTIGRNYVLRAREIDPKSLIVEAYEKGLMIAVIPFTSKVLEPCQKSIAYQPPNPWTMAILGLLAEIYSMPNLKMNLKFDIEVLFKILGVDLKEVAPTSLLKDRKREIDGNPDFSNKDLGVPHISQPQMIPEPKTISPLKQIDLPLDVANSPNTDPSKLLSQYAAPQRVYSNSLMEDEKVATLGLSDQLPSPQGLFQSTPSPLFSISQLSAALPNIGNHVVINQKLSAYGMHYQFQRVVPLAMDRAIKEIVSGIVQRSVCIACQTTKELVLKDYALEPDETRIYNAAHLMVASLAGSLAHVTCKEPLRTSISGHLRSSLQGLSVPNESVEQIVHLVTNDNLDLGCAAIEQAATEKAIQTIDADISQQLLLRRKHRDGAGSSFFDPNMLSQNSVSLIPESLRPKPGHLSLSQQRVYEDFVQHPWQKQSTQTSHALSAASSSSGDVAIGSGYGSVSGKVASEFLSNVGNCRMDMISRSSDISVDGFESSPVSLLSSQVDTTGDSAGLQLSKSLPSPEIESSDAAMKETGTSLQTLTSTATMERLGGNNITQPSLSTRDALDKYQIVIQKMEELVANSAGDDEIQAVVSEVPEIILRCISRDEAALAVAQKAFKALYENASSALHVSANLAILVAIRDVCKRVAKELTSWVIYSEEERKLNKDITIGLIQRELLNLAEYNVHMAKHLDGGRNKSATDFAISLLQSLVTEKSSVISELHSLVDALAKLASKAGSSESLQQLIDIIRNPVTNTADLSESATGNENIDRQKDYKVTRNTTTSTEENSSLDYVESDPAGFRNRVSMLFENWYQICELSGANESACSQYVLHLHQTGLLKGDDTTESFFRTLLELSVAHCISSEDISSGAVQSPQQAQSPSFLIIDMYAKLVFSILKYFPEQDSSSKLFLLSEVEGYELLSKIMAVTVRSIQKDAEDKKASLNPKPYFRLFINWLLDLCSLDPGTDGVNFQVLIAFANTFHALQPLKIPAFSFAWLELISHRSFMPKLLTVNGQKGWPYVQRLLVDLLQFLEPFLRNAELGGPVHFLYKGTLRVLLVLLHDFPEFLCDYHFTFCDVIPSSCIQMRNIILSSFPRNMRLPDPSTPNLKIDLLPEIVEAPCILSEVDAALKAKQMKNDVDEYLASRQQNSTFLTELKQKLLLSSSEAGSAGTRYSVPLINSLVLYTGMQAIQQLQASETQAQNVVALQMFKYLSMELDTEGRYLFLNAIANQLRYPNNHTHYFSFIMLYLFFESDQEIIQEQITRVLLERLIVNRPHPWGLLITFIELIKNPRYGFWKQAFIRCAPEIEKLFESVARSCGGLKPTVDEGMVSGWVSDNSH